MEILHIPARNCKWCFQSEWLCQKKKSPSSFLLNAWETRGFQKGPVLTSGKSPTHLENFRSQFLICLRFASWENRGLRCKTCLEGELKCLPAVKFKKNKNTPKNCQHPRKPQQEQKNPKKQPKTNQPTTKQKNAQKNQFQNQPKTQPTNPSAEVLMEDLTEQIVRGVSLSLSHFSIRTCCSQPLPGCVGACPQLWGKP